MEMVKICCFYLYILIWNDFIDPGDLACDGPLNYCLENLHVPCDCNANSTGVFIRCVYDEQQQEQLQYVPSPLPSNLISIQIIGHNLMQVRKTDLQDCVRLRNIDFGFNNISQIETDAFISVTKLQVLRLNANLLNISEEDSFPKGCLDPLENLEVLYLEFNNWGPASGYRMDIFQRKPKLTTMAMDLLHDVPLPPNVSFSKLKVLILKQGIDIFRNNTLDNWKQLPIEHLSINTLFSNYNLTKIEPNSFSMFPTLKVLDLSLNPNLVNNTHRKWHGLLGAFVGLNKTGIRTLHMVDISRTGTETDISKEILNSLGWIDNTLESLYLDDNGFTGIHGVLSQYLPHLKYLSLAYNRFFAFLFEDITNSIGFMPNLEYINLNKQTRWVMRKRKNPDNFMLRSLNMNRYFDKCLHFNLLFPPKLKSIHLRDSLDSSELCIGNITIRGGPERYEVIDVSQNNFNLIEGPLVMESSQTHTFGLLNFSGCGISRFGKEVFASNIEIDTIDLSFNVGIMSNLDSDLFLQFEKVKLKSIDLTLCNLKYIPTKLFFHSRSLERIILKNNAIGSLRDHSLRHLVNLTHLDISDNKFFYLLQSTWQEFDEMAVRNPNFKMDISRNPFEINCATLEFLKWIRNPKVTLVNEDKMFFFFTDGINDTIYKMENLSSVILHMDISCYSRTWVVVSCVMSTLLIVALIISMIGFKFRWNIRYFCFRLSHQRTVYQELVNLNRYEFDAFLVFHYRELHWVLRDLVPALEIHHPIPLKLCIPQRDWIPGPAIEENIISNIEKSRKTLIILTRQFLRDKSCELKMELAKLRESEVGQRIMIVVVLEFIPIKEMSVDLLELKHKTTWLEWPDDPEDQNRCWKLLHQSLSKPCKEYTQCTCGAQQEPNRM